MAAVAQDKELRHRAPVVVRLAKVERQAQVAAVTLVAAAAAQAEHHPEAAPAEALLAEQEDYQTAKTDHPASEAMAPVQAPLEQMPAYTAEAQLVLRVHR